MQLMVYIQIWLLCTAMITACRKHKKTRNKKRKHNSRNELPDIHLAEVTSSTMISHHASLIIPGNPSVNRRHASVKKPALMLGDNSSGNLPAAAVPAKDCCHKRGMCVMGAFCVCKKKYHGRYCQYRKRSCGNILDGEAYMDNCNVCVCVDGSLSCKVLRSRECGYEHDNPHNGTVVLNFSNKDGVDDPKLKFFSELYNTANIQMKHRIWIVTIVMYFLFRTIHGY